MSTLRFICADVLDLLRGRWSLRSDVESLHEDFRVAMGWAQRREVDRMEDEREEWRERAALLERQREEGRTSVFRRRTRRIRSEFDPELQFGRIIPTPIVGISHDCVHVRIDGRERRVHLPELSWGDIKHPAQVLAVGREVRVKVLSVPSDAQHPFLILT